MSVKERILLSWSGGKDSAMTLYELQKSEQYEVVSLLTTVTEGYNRISMHGVRRELLDQQAEAIGIPLHKIYIPKGCVNDEYETRMKAAMLLFREQGIRSVAFGDLFLADIRQYREAKLAKADMKGIFPIWMRNTYKMLEEFINLGFKAVLSCVDPKQLDPSFAGRAIDHGFQKDLPENVDPCGENGEFHSFVHAGPIFKQEVKISIGEVVLRDNFYFCDLLPK